MTSEIDDDSLVKFIDTFRFTTESSAIIPVDGGDHRCVVDWEMLLSLGLLQLKPAAFETPAEDRLSFDEQTEEQTLRPYPSLHSCFVCNVVAAVSMLTEGRESRFVRRGCIPPVYLSCTMNYILNDDDSGADNDGAALCPRIETYEPAIASQQELCMEEAKKFEEVNWCLHPRFGCDWLGYFNHYFVLEQFYELWRGDLFVGTSKSLPQTSRRRLESYPCYSLKRSSLIDFDNDSKGSFGGCVVLFRHLVPNSQLFGIWFLWLRVEGRLLIVDLQNSILSQSLQEAVTSLRWDSPPMSDVFFAPFKHDLFGSIDGKLPKHSRTNDSEAPDLKFKIAKSN